MFVLQLSKFEAVIQGQRFVRFRSVDSVIKELTEARKNKAP